MEGKSTMVTLAAGEEKREFTLEHAEGLLTMNLRGGSGWTLADPDWELADGHLARAKKDNKKDKE